MRSGQPRYPVDRYLVESSNKFEMVNIIGDDLWNAEPALRPEDEIVLRKLHEMLRSTADDLKLLSGELAKFHEPGVQVKSAPTPLDEQFNEKVHIEELVNAKFHGYQIVEMPPRAPELKPRNSIDGPNLNRTIKILNTDAQAKAPVTKRPVINRNLGISRTRIIQIDSKNQVSDKNEVLNNGKVINSAPAVAYNEFSFKYSEPKVTNCPLKSLRVQHMPKINIRGELKAQNVLQLDIEPGQRDDNDVKNAIKSNVSVIAVTHGDALQKINEKPQASVQRAHSDIGKATVRKISQMSMCESSESTNNTSSDAKAQQITQKRVVSGMKNSPKTSARIKKNVQPKKESDRRPRFDVDEWRKKLNGVYGSTSYKKNKAATRKVSPKKSSLAKKDHALNNAEYIPYSKLTLGGVNVSDIEREISNIPNKNDMPLSPILDKILSSRENSFHKESAAKRRPKESPRILTTSDENLLQEVIDIEKSVSETLSKNLRKKLNEPVLEGPKSPSTSDDEIAKNESYADDFEDDNSERSGHIERKSSGSDSESNEKSEKPQHDRLTAPTDAENDVPHSSKDLGNKTFTMSSNLTYKESVDIFEFIHSVDKHDSATQSNGSANKIAPKETQTSPRNDKPNIQPIHNDLWPSIDPRREVEKMFELEKDFIKKLILHEYGDMLEKTINKPSTSNENNEQQRKNVAAAQKNTQTSPAHVKSVMTSPRLTKTRTTSPLLLTVPVHRHTSPMIVVTNEHDTNSSHTVEADNISVNLSSPRFSLRLPQTSREVLSNLEHSRSQTRVTLKREVKMQNRTFTKSSVSSSSAEADKSSSDMSSLGEVKIKRRPRKKTCSISEDSSSSTVSKYSLDLLSGGILPLKSEGEVSLGQAPRRFVRPSKSDGETSVGPSK